MKQTLILIALVGLAHVTYGQTLSTGQDTISWKIDELTDPANDITEVSHCKFITTPAGMSFLEAGKNKMPHSFRVTKYIKN